MENKVEIIRANSESLNYQVRVGAYCRVSSDSADQVNSFFAQMQYYSDYIKSNQNMIFVDIYADEGITGTSAKKRNEFNRMINDCKKRRLDRILVKSVTRFARNSLECIEAIRKLKSYGVSVYFENDNIDTALMNSEMILYIKSAFAQSEAVSASKRMQTSINMRMKDGTYFNASIPYGYYYEGGKVIVNSDEATVIKNIYDMYLSGKGYTLIAENLSEKTGKHWGRSEIEYILSNEFYIGDRLYGKSYKDFFPRKQVTNHGEKDSFYYEDVHPGIIERGKFDLVQKERVKRAEKYNKSINEQGDLHGYIRCRHCGWRYKEVWRNDKLYWQCAKKGYEKNDCKSPCLPDDYIKSQFVSLVNILRQNKKVLIDDTLRSFTMLKLKVKKDNEEIEKIDRRIREISEKKEVYLKLYCDNLLDESVYMSYKNQMDIELSELKARRKHSIDDDMDDKFINALKDLNKTLLSIKNYIIEFDLKIFNDIVDKIYVEENGDLSFLLKCGVEMKNKKEEDICRVEG